MWSQKEYEDLVWKLNNIPSTITGKSRQNLRQVFRKKLKEHKYASTYPPFTPIPYELFFINYRTTEETLTHLIETINSCTTFTLDTESVGIYKQRNKPALIQLQIILTNTLSYILIIEACRLPRTTETTFSLIQQLFNALFQEDKNIYIWGTIDELQGFNNLNLFSPNQIYSSNNINFQEKFKKYWNEHHPHNSSSTSADNLECICEMCLGIQPNNPWSIQDAVALQLNRWLDKRQTRSQFDIGLDPKLVHLNAKELEHRQSISNYAANDCDAIFQLLLNMNIIGNPQESYDSSNEIIITTPTYINSSTNNSPEPQPTEPAYEPISSDEDEPYEQQLIQEHQSTDTQQNKLSEEERRIIHNRSCTLKQRKRYYRHEIIRRNIDSRFSVKEIKQILRQNHVLFSAVNKPRSSLTGKTSLYIGIKDETQLNKYNRRLQHLFTKTHYNQLQYEKQRKMSHMNHHHRSQRQY